jgi:hypothetical protein
MNSLRSTKFIKVVKSKETILWRDHERSSIYAPIGGAEGGFDLV